MPASYVIDQDHRVVFSRGWDGLTDADLARHQAALLRDPAFEPTFAQLWDLREISDTASVSVKGVRCLAGREVFGPWARRAFVAPRPLSFKLARIFAVLRKQRGESGIEVFRDLASACDWIGLR